MTRKEPKTTGSDARDRGSDLIEDNLKRVYSEVVNEPLPDKLAGLLDRLKNGSDKSNDA